MNDPHRQGEALRAARERRGESIAAAAAVLRIDPAHLRALEAGELHRLPDGPFAVGWLRTYRRHLGMPEVSVARSVVQRLNPDRAPMWAVRAVAGGAAALAILLAFSQLLPRAAAPEGGALPSPADQHVAVLARKNAPLRVWVDGGVVYDGTLPGGERVEVAGRDKVEVAVAAAESVRVEYNGTVIAPQGRQDTPRRLVFIDDLAGGE